MMRDTIHRVAGALSEGRPDAVVRAIQNSFLVRPRLHYAPVSFSEIHIVLALGISNMTACHFFIQAQLEYSELELAWRALFNFHQEAPA